MARRQRALLDGGYPYLVAEIDGAIAGYAYVGPYRTRPAYRWSVEDSIYVARDRHRRGLGASLLASLIVEAENRGFRQMIAVIGDSRQVPSIELHRAAGFRLIGTIENVGFKFGRWLDSVLMQRTLGEGATTGPQSIANSG
jgi:L-amino acid N-acyltransferase YncA